jgi:hypothetical protein
MTLGPLRHEADLQTIEVNNEEVGLRAPSDRCGAWRRRPHRNPSSERHKSDDGRHTNGEGEHGEGDQEVACESKAEHQDGY